MAITDINSEDRLVQATFAEHLHDELGWNSVYAWNTETFGPRGLLGRENTRDVVLTRDLRAAIARLNPDLPDAAVDEALKKMTRHDFTRSLLQHNQEFYQFIRDGVPVDYKDSNGQLRQKRARVIDFQNGVGANGQPNNRFLAVRELKLTGLRTPGYNRRADLVCFVNGLPLVFIELKAVYKNIRDGFEGNLRDYLDENVISHAFAHNAFIIVSNGHRARYGSITSQWEHFAEWKRNDESEAGSVEAEVLLNGMLRPDRLLDIVENFILFDSSKAGATRKVIARNHQVLGVNNAVASVVRQEELKAEFPPEKRVEKRFVELPAVELTDQDVLATAELDKRDATKPMLQWVEAAHPDLGKLGVFWHTQGSGKSYSMAFFTEKVRRHVSAKFTFLLMTDRKDLDSQIYKTFVGCGVANEQTPRASTGDDLKRLLSENHRYIFSLIHKFNQDVDPHEPYSTRDDIIVISDEAHRTQAGKLARNMRLAVPNASFIGFTGTPLFTHDNLTKKIFGKYVSTYDFKRSEEDGATVKLVYDNRGEKLKIARLDLNDRIAEAIEKAELDPDQEQKLEKLLGQDYEVITADERLDKVAADFVEYCAARWESGKSMLVCVDKITCGRMWKRVMPLWDQKIARIQIEILQIKQQLESDGGNERLAKEIEWLEGQADWLEETKVAIIISEGQKEVADFNEWGIDIIPHRALIKQGFELADGKRIDVETAFKDPQHQFRVAIVCAMWLTGFDVESLSTLYIDKPMKAHTLMQAIARANRVYPGKDFGLIVDYNGMLKALRAALAQYALGPEGQIGGEEEVVEPIEVRLKALLAAIEETEKHLRSLGFEPKRLDGAKGFARIEALADAVEAVHKSRTEGRRKFEILARQVFARFKGLMGEGAAYVLAERHDDIEAIYKKLQEHVDTANVTDVLKELHRIVNQAIRTAEPGEDQTDSRLYDMSTIDLEKLRNEFAKKVKRKASAVEDIRLVVEKKLAQMLRRNPQRMDYYKKYSEIIADYNGDKDRVTIEETFARLTALVAEMDEEDHRAAEEGLSDEEYALFCLLKKENISQAERERVKLASRNLLGSLQRLIRERQHWIDKEQTQAEVEVMILDNIYENLPTPPFTEDEKSLLAKRVYEHVWQQSVSGNFIST